MRKTLKNARLHQELETSQTKMTKLRQKRMISIRGTLNGRQR